MVYALILSFLLADDISLISVIYDSVLNDLRT